jgi:hypothetical protein
MRGGRSSPSLRLIQRTFEPISCSMDPCDRGRILSNIGSVVVFFHDEETETQL